MAQREGRGTAGAGGAARAAARGAAWALLAAASAGVSADALAGAEAPLDRARSLLEEKMRLERENAVLRQELAYAATPHPYILVDLAAGSFEFRVRGKAHKTYTALAVELRDAAGRPIGIEELRRLAPEAVEVERKGEGPPEFKPPPAEGEAPEAEGRTDPNGAPRPTDAGLLGVDAPTDYDVDLEGGVRIEVRTRHDATRWERARRQLSEMGLAVADAVGGWLRSRRPDQNEGPRAVVRVTFDAARAKAFYHSILPTERFHFLPGPPPPVTLIASAAVPPPPAAVAGSAGARGKAPAGARPARPARGGSPAAGGAAAD
jgi:hypothetical protein